MFWRENVLAGKCFGGKMFWRENVLAGNLLAGFSLIFYKYSEAGLLNKKNSCLAPTLGVTKFINLNLVALCRAA